MSSLNDECAYCGHQRGIHCGGYTGRCERLLGEDRHRCRCYEFEDKPSKEEEAFKKAWKEVESLERKGK